METNNKVFIGMLESHQISYPKADFGFSPSIAYPEYPFETLSKKPNDVYEMVRYGLHALHLDDDNYGLKEWNPLGDMIHLGDTVVIKPNMVMHQNRIKQNGTDCMITHPSLVRTIIDYSLIALKGTGKVVVADAPIQECDYELMMDVSGYNNLINYYRTKGIQIDFIDLRNYKTHVEHGVNIQQEISNPNSSFKVDLARNSAFADIPAKRFDKLRVTNYDPAIMSQHHSPDKNEYSIAAEILNADVIINMPKPKTHRYAGLTLSLKNMIGINTNKEWLPHHTVGSNMEGGDAYLYCNVLKNISDVFVDRKNRALGSKRYIIARIYVNLAIGTGLISRFISKDDFRNGSWYGNDTIWRTILDLNRIVRYADKNGNLCDFSQRKIFNIADMIISGEKEGPLSPSPKQVGIIAMAEDAVCMDEVLATIMGVDYHNIPSINNARLPHQFPIGCSNEAHIISNNSKWDNKDCSQLSSDDCLSFVLTNGWKNYKSGYCDTDIKKSNQE
ncbi:MAG: DUF362 domain-containing protein [Atribacterota bacterium]|nr:DUF362 domain-containing protein [Atribacterota bacterium]